MKRILLIVMLLTISTSKLMGQEIIPFPDLSDHHDYRKNGGKSLDEKNYSMFSEDYQDQLKKLDQEIDQISAERSDQTNQELIDSLNNQLDILRKKRLALLNEAELVDDLHSFY